ncbi:universal stress protein [Halopiger xanaduensis]|uniref:UspA domain-containing protein n=1 Tax=Halopiger xanaduensis (strain DSM 18323 / JCM 14033 / SH-6) TaxID=797210 RepID=F8DE94_HALXS|nr:universal stress protein [Halopiger xanaduensis]AEH39376.1 UspA domain-containing protein [Halopiger xanaduensis SH-6]
MSERILVPYDGSDPAEAALEFAFETFPDAGVTALYVVPVPEGYWQAFGAAEEIDRKRGRKRGEEILEEATAIAREHDRNLETVIETGKPDQMIVSQAEEEEYDTVVIGSHGREGVSRILLGSVAENVVRRSPTPVVVVR